MINLSRVVENGANFDGRVSIEVWDKNSLSSDKLLGCMAFTAEEIKTSQFARFVLKILWRNPGVTVPFAEYSGGTSFWM